MRLFDSNLLRICVIAAAASFVLSSPSYAQKHGGGGGAIPPEVLRAQQEEADFNALLRQQDTDKKIKLITKFLNNYPASRDKEIVYNELVSAYYAKQDWDNFYATADKAIGSYPDDVDVLTLVGWVIPHVFNSSDADAGTKLDEAETYEKHAIELITPMAKPATVADDQFNTAKATKLSQAHSGLGLIYFRKQDWDDAVKELQEATQAEQPPDPTDLYALAFGLEQLSRYQEAAEEYDKCSAVPGTLQSRCKTSADNARSQIQQSK